MRNKIFPVIMWMALIAITQLSCKKYNDTEVVRSPQVAFINTDSLLVMQATDSLRLSPIVVKGDNIAHQWTLNGQVISTDAQLRYQLNDVGEFQLVYTATNQNGTTTKNFAVRVSPTSIQGVIFSTSDTTFTKSIGERLDITATVSGSEPVTHEWTVNGEVVSTTNKLNYNILEAGDKEIDYKITRNNAQFSKRFYITGISSAYGHWFKFQDGEQYVLCLKSDETKVLTHNPGASQYTFETYTGSNKQLFKKGAYFGYGDANVQLEYYNLYNLETKTTINERGEVTDAQVDNNGNASPDGWRGYYFEVDGNGYARMIHFLQTWDYTATYTVALKGCIMRASDDGKNLVPYFYDRCKVDGIRDYGDYNALAGKYFDLKIKNVNDMK